MQNKKYSKHSWLPSVALGGLAAAMFLQGCGGGDDGFDIVPTPTPGTGATPTPVTGNTPTPGPTRTPTSPGAAQFAGTYLTSYQGTGDEDGNVQIVVPTSGGISATIVSPNEGRFTGTGILTPTSATTATFNITGTSSTSVARSTRALTFTFTGTITTTGGRKNITGTFRAGTISGTVTGTTAPTTNPFAGTFSGPVQPTGNASLTVSPNGNVTANGTVAGVPFTGTGFIDATTGQFTASGLVAGTVLGVSGRVTLVGTTLRVTGTVQRNKEVVGTFSFTVSATGGTGGTG